MPYRRKIGGIRFREYKKGRGTRSRSVLDRQIKIGDLLKYSLIVAGVIIVLVGVFMLGRLSGGHTVYDDSPVLKSSSSETTLQETEPEEAEEESVEEEIEEAEEPEEIVEEVVELEPAEEVEEEEDDKKYKEAEFGYNYHDVEIDIGKVTHRIRGNDWGTLTSLELTVTNNEDVIINPTFIKIKIYKKGYGSEWWDDTVRLPMIFRKMKPGDTVTEVVDTHASFSELGEEKEIRLRLFDDYDIEIDTIDKALVIS